MFSNYMASLKKLYSMTSTPQGSYWYLSLLYCSNFWCLNKFWVKYSLPLFRDQMSKFEQIYMSLFVIRYVSFKICRINDRVC